MTKYIFAAVALLFLAAGCVSRQAETVYGDKCEKISDSQAAHLVKYARYILLNNVRKHKFTAVEKRILENDIPQIRYEYRGDCFGSMYIQWETPTRRLGICFDGDLNKNAPASAMLIGASDGRTFNTTKPDKTQRGR
jgi:hypothetical protein